VNSKVYQDKHGKYSRFGGTVYRPQVSLKGDYQDASAYPRVGSKVKANRRSDGCIAIYFGEDKNNQHCERWFPHGKLKGGVKPEDCWSPVVKEDEYSLPVNSENMAVYLVYETVSNCQNKTTEEIYKQLEDDEEQLTLSEVQHILSALCSLGFIKLEQRTEYKVCE